MPNPIAVLISDVHYNVHTLKLADEAMNMAVRISNDLKVPLIVAGDLHDTKANLRGECVNAMIETFKKCLTPARILVGNHDRLNEKAPEHSLNFLNAYAHIIDQATIYLPFQRYPFNTVNRHLCLIPYYHDAEELRAYLSHIPKSSLLIMHQGLTTSNSGDYIQDKSALNPGDVQDFRVISGHYHQRQDIKTGRPRKGAVGLWSYIGNPYTLTYGESHDPPKGFQILMDDGTLEFVGTYLRRHIIHKCDSMLLSTLAAPKLKTDDLLWLKVQDSRENLHKVDKTKIQAWLSAFNGFTVSFKLDLIPTDSSVCQVNNTKNLTNGPLLDHLIDSSDIQKEHKERLKQTWKTLCE